MLPIIIYDSLTASAGASGCEKQIKGILGAIRRKRFHSSAYANADTLARKVVIKL